MRGTLVTTLVCGAMVGIALVGVPRSASRALPSDDGASASGECASCHPAEVREWQTSRHAQAWRDPIFQTEFAHGRPAWCVSCHAPLAADPTAPDDGDPRVTQGVGCAACHERDGRMVSSRRAPGSPHATVVDRDFGSPDFCARCHEFNFPILGERGRLVRYTDEPMQSTVSEWRATGTDATCLDCHRDGEAGHAFRGSHDPDRVADSLAITVCRVDRSTIEVALANDGAAHNVPSGGVHRRMVLRAWRSTAPEQLAEQTLGRKFRPLAAGGKTTTADTTIAPGAVRRVRFALSALGPAHGDPAVNIELRYIYALDERAELPTDVSKVIWYRRMDPEQLDSCVRRGAVSR